LIPIPHAPMQSLDCELYSANAKDQVVAAVDLPCEKPPTATRLHLIVIWIDCRVLIQDLPSNCLASRGRMMSGPSVV
jgi:hypothetical protein